MATVTPIAEIDGAYTVEPDVHADDRGFMLETYRRSWFPGQREMVQANRGDRGAGTIVGLHYHLHQSDYWYVPRGLVRVVLFDLRDDGATDGGVWTIDLGSADGADHVHTGVYIPPGVAHGFAALTDCTLSYLVDAYYNPADELGVAWNDPGVTVDWGISEPVLSARDQSNPVRSEIAPQRRPHRSLRTT